METILFFYWKFLYLLDKYKEEDERQIIPYRYSKFWELSERRYLYVDKTRLIYRLVKTGRYYFLSRPRRFGKSLLISTLEAYFRGKRELFQGLAMEELEKEWVRHPILHLDLNIEKYDSVESLGNILNNVLIRWEKEYGSEPSEVSFSLTIRWDYSLDPRVNRATGGHSCWWVR